MRTTTHLDALGVRNIELDCLNPSGFSLDESLELRCRRGVPSGSDDLHARVAAREELSDEFEAQTAACACDKVGRH